MQRKAGPRTTAAHAHVRIYLYISLILFCLQNSETPLPQVCKTYLVRALRDELGFELFGEGQVQAVFCGKGFFAHHRLHRDHVFALGVRRVQLVRHRAEGGGR